MHTQFSKLNCYLDFLCVINPINAELNPICHLLTLLGPHLILHVSRIRVKIFLEHMLRTILFSSVFTQHPVKYSKTSVGFNCFLTVSICVFYSIGTAVPVLGWTGPEGSRRLRLVKMSVLQTGHLYPPSKYSWYLFLLDAESTPESLCGRKNCVNEKFQ